MRNGAALADSTDRRPAGGSSGKVAALLIAVGALLSVLTVFSDNGPARLGHAYLWGFAFVWTIVLGSLFFVALQHVTRSVWSVVIRRVAEMFAAPIWVLGLLFLPVLLFAALHDPFGLFPWTDAELVAGDHVLEGKQPYLNLPFFAARAVVFFLCWIAFTRFFIGNSLKQDAGAGVEGTLRMRRLSAPFMPVFAITVTFASFDWFMSLEPHWFSTIFGVYIFGGMAATALAAITIAVVWMRARGYLERAVVTDEHLYSLGGLLFAFTCFWAYIAFSQFMLIWYGNLPEETFYLVNRTEHGWGWVALALIALRFVVPFFLLLARDAKMDPRRLVVASVVVLAGELLDLFWLIMPQVQGDAPHLGWQEVGPPLLFAGVLVFYLGRFRARHRLVASGDPLYEQSRMFRL